MSILTMAWWMKQKAESIVMFYKQKKQGPEKLTDLFWFTFVKQFGWDSNLYLVTPNLQ